MINKYIVALLVFCFFGCDKKNERGYQYDSFGQEYVEKLVKFPNALIAHFPKEILSPAKYSSGFDSKYNSVYMELNLKPDTKEIDSIVIALNKEAKVKYSAMDSCILIANRFTKMDNEGYENSYKSELARPNNCSSNYLPIPNFWNSEFKSIEINNRLTEDFEIFVSDAKSGVYWDDLHRNSGRYMPDEWKKGYSRGVAISKKEGVVIYWLIIW